MSVVGFRKIAPLVLNRKFGLAAAYGVPIALILWGESISLALMAVVIGMYGFFRAELKEVSDDSESFRLRVESDWRARFLAIAALMAVAMVYGENASREDARRLRSNLQAVCNDVGDTTICERLEETRAEVSGGRAQLKAIELD